MASIGRALSKLIFPTHHAEEILVNKVAGQSKYCAVGVQETRNSHGAAIRIFYPASQTENATRTSLFRNPLAFVVEGYNHTFFGSLVPTPVLSVINYILSFFIWMHPLAWTTLPRCYNNIPICDGKFPLIVWSHGLTGTGCEHGMLAITLALRGNIVVLTHHSDGSSSLADINTGLAISSATKLKYIHPSYDQNYDTGFRQRQVEYRAKEVEEARNIVLSTEIGKSISNNKIIVGGFSFGAATAGLVAATYPHIYQAAILIDGWWHIELKKLKINQDLPIQVFEKGIKIPTIFIGSAEFESYPALCDATLRLQKLTSTKEVHVIPGTRHGNFMDAIWWLPVFVTKSLGFSGISYPREMYSDYIALIADFVEKHTN